mgnify:CR=1 FL=1
MNKTDQHKHLTRRAIKTQLHYAESDIGFETAREIISVKIANARMILTDFRQARARAGFEHAGKIESIVARIRRFEKEARRVERRESLFRIEAFAAKAYWDAVRLIARRPALWRRKYPGSPDSFNTVLNGGYRLLASRSMQAIQKAGLLPEIGVLHGEHSRDGLVYDFMECFRHPLVDAVVLPLFSRRNFGASLNEKSEGRAFGIIDGMYKKRFWYRGRCEKMARILDFEAIKLRKAMMDKKLWKVYRHRWGHRNRCSP